MGIHSCFTEAAQCAGAAILRAGRQTLCENPKRGGERKTGFDCTIAPLSTGGGDQLLSIRSRQKSTRGAYRRCRRIKAMKWVTRANVGIDRMGCAWLIRKFIDSKAEFVFVPNNDSPLPKGAEPFDIPGVRLSHHGGHCSFYAMVREYKLKDPILKRMARIIDEADTVQEVLVEPSAAGLDLICGGIRLISADDREAIARGALVYGALYAALS